MATKEDSARAALDGLVCLLADAVAERVIERLRSGKAASKRDPDADLNDVLDDIGWERAS